MTKEDLNNLRVTLLFMINNQDFSAKRLEDIQTLLSKLNNPTLDVELTTSALTFEHPYEITIDYKAGDEVDFYQGEHEFRDYWVYEYSYLYLSDEGPYEAFKNGKTIAMRDFSIVMLVINNKGK